MLKRCQNTVPACSVTRKPWPVRIMLSLSLVSVLESEYGLASLYRNSRVQCVPVPTSGSAMAEGPREALVSRNPATTKNLT